MQDRAVINTVSTVDNGFPADVFIGERVTIGHGALLTSCTVGSRVLIGQGAIVQAGSDIGSESMIAAGAVVLPNTVVPSKQLWAGNPAKYIRDLTDEEVESLEKVRTVSFSCNLFCKHVSVFMFCFTGYFRYYPFKNESFSNSMHIDFVIITERQWIYSIVKGTRCRVFAIRNCLPGCRGERHCVSKQY